jgi:phosphonate transport system substrate-binding protein
MRQYLSPVLAFILILVFMTGCTEQEKPKKVSLFARAGDSTPEASPLLPNTLWFGFDLRLGPRDEVMIYTPFLRYLEDTTGRHFRIRFTERYEDTVRNLGTGVTHFAALGTLSYVTGVQKYGIRYLVSGVNSEGDPRDRSVIIVRADSGISSIRELAGKCFAFGAKMSAQGHLIPRYMLEQAGITLGSLGRFIYTGSHINAVSEVVNGRCDAAGVQEVIASRLVSEGKVTIIERSPPYPSSVIAYSASLDPKIVSELRSALLAFDPTGRHRKMLVDWERTAMPLGFTVIDEAEFDEVRKLAEKYGVPGQ